MVMNTATPPTNPALPRTYLVTAVKGRTVQTFEWQTRETAVASARRLAAVGFAVGVLPPGTWGRK